MVCHFVDRFQCFKCFIFTIFSIFSKLISFSSDLILISNILTHTIAMLLWNFPAQTSIKLDLSRHLQSSNRDLGRQFLTSKTSAPFNLKIWTAKQRVKMIRKLKSIFKDKRQPHRVNSYNLWAETRIRLHFIRGICSTFEHNCLFAYDFLLLRNWWVLKWESRPYYRHSTFICSDFWISQLILKGLKHHLGFQL